MGPAILTLYDPGNLVVMDRLAWPTLFWKETTQITTCGQWARYPDRIEGLPRIHVQVREAPKSRLASASHIQRGNLWGHAGVLLELILSLVQPLTSHSDSVLLEGLVAIS